MLKYYLQVQHRQAGVSTCQVQSPPGRVPFLRLLSLQRDGRQRRRCAPPRAFHIDHRHHLNLAWERQKREEEELARVGRDVESTHAVVRTKNLQHLEKLLEAAGGRLVILALHSPSCGVCKEVFRGYEQICRESHSQRARIIFLSHDVVDEFDSASDIARYYSIKAVPRFLFFVDGALVKAVGMGDVRQWRGTRAQMETVLQSEQQRLKETLWQLLVKNAPSARR